MDTSAQNGPMAFFKAQHAAFAATIRGRRGERGFVRELTAQAFDSFEGNVAIQTEGMPQIACHVGCADCCMLRVVGSAPEILLVAQYIVATRPAFAKVGIDLAQRLADEDRVTRGLDEQRRMALRRHCPFIENGSCAIYMVRPLACRGHAAYDRSACFDAAAGLGGDAKVSEPHLVVRSLVQNALLSALRDAGLAWRLYELNRAAEIALSDPKSEEAWLAGDDPFAAAAAPEVDARQMATAFDEIKAG
jgi:Fe-S-cluster containining protein